MNSMELLKMADGEAIEKKKKHSQQLYPLQ